MGCNGPVRNESMMKWYMIHPYAKWAWKEPSFNFNAMMHKENILKNFIIAIREKYAITKVSC